MNKILTFAVELAKKGGMLLKENVGRLREDQIKEKGPRDMVTEMDKAIEQRYAEAIRKTFPDHGILGEEGTEEGGDREFLWVIDPLDGTKNYINQVPFFCTVLCLLRHQEPVVSVIYEPVTGQLYTAIKGQGAAANGRPVRVSAISEPEKSTLLYCHSRELRDIQFTFRYVPKLKTVYRDVARLRSAGCEMAMVARGSAEAYAMSGLPLWDLAAGALLVREAGGKATDFAGKEWQPGDRNILVSNGTGIHDRILGELKRVTSNEGRDI